MLSSILAVQRPGYFFLSRCLQRRRFKAIHKIRINISVKKCCHDGVQLHRIRRSLDQGHFKFPVIQLDIFPCNSLKSPYRKGVRDHTKNEISFQNLPVMFYTHRIGFYSGQPLHPLQHICHMSKYILDILSGLIGNLRKETKCCNIYKDIIIKTANITAKGSAIHDHMCSVNHILWNLKAIGKIISAPCGNITDRKSFVTLHHSGDHLI